MNTALTIAPPDEVKRLLKMSSSVARKTLEACSRDTALRYIVELFHGNGWIVVVTRHTGSDTLLLSDPKNAQAIVLMVKLALHDGELTYHEAREELLDFENNLSPKYGCSQFAIIAMNGVSHKAERLERFNLLLQDWSYIDELIANYSTAKIREPRIQLFAHNKQTYKKVRGMMASCKSIAVVQATGTGKSFLIAKLLQDFSGQRRLVMAPSLYVIEQVKEHIRWDAGSIEFMTYARSMNLSRDDIAALKPGMIVLDEFHRCGAEEWGRGVNNILQAYKGAFIFGTSATPIRYMDSGRDMSYELFDNNVAENLSLAQAIVRNILPMPKYVCALYTLTEEIDKMRSRVAASRSSAAVKQRILLDLDATAIDWEQSHGVPSVLKKYLRKHMKKFIVFCRDEQHLLEMEPAVAEWFATATGNADIKTYRVYEGDTNSAINLKDFKEAGAAGGIHLLLSINMLNEGLHINEVSGVVLLRPTESPNIFYQQIGRCLKVGLAYSPVIFDLVNNFKSIRTNDFLHDLEFARTQYVANRVTDNLEDNCPVFTVVDEVREITEVFGEIKFRLDEWEAQFENLVAYKSLFGDCNVPNGPGEYRSLGHWLYVQRKKYEKGLLEPLRYKKLLDLEVDLSLIKAAGWEDEVWQNNFEDLCTFRKKYGHCNVSTSEKEFPKLRGFIDGQRRRYKLGTLLHRRLNKLLSIGFEFESNYLEGKWQSSFDQLVAYKNKRGHFKMSRKEKTPLIQWMVNQRKHCRENTIDEVRKQKLNSIGFTWGEEADVVFEKKFLALVAWGRQHGHFNISRNDRLNNTALYFRKLHKRGTLAVEKVQHLKDLGFDFTQGDNFLEIREKRLKQVERFFKANGHGHITPLNEPHKGLNNWLIFQRKKYKEGSLPEDFMSRMEAAGVDWNHKKSNSDKLWNIKYQQLLSIYRQSGSLTLPPSKNSNLLNAWCSMQRKLYSEGKLDPGRLDKLNELGFKWEVYEEKWEENFIALALYKEQHGNCLVNSNKPETEKLGAWCIGARKAYRERRLAEERVKRLAALGFIWDVRESNWFTNYESFKEHINQYGWKGLCTLNAQKYAWVNAQRRDYKAKRLGEEKVMLLNMLGIDWVPGTKKQE